MAKFAIHIKKLKSEPNQALWLRNLVSQAHHSVGVSKDIKRKRREVIKVTKKELQGFRGQRKKGREDESEVSSIRNRED